MTDAPAPRKRVRAAPEENTHKNPMHDPKTEIGATIAAISKAHGPMVIRSADMMPVFKHIPTGVFSLDMACLGGFPQGAVTLGKGWEHSGKTTVGLRFLGRSQKKTPKMTSVLVDVEGTYAPEWGAIQGIDNSRLALVQPTSGEEALDVTMALIRSEEVSALMIDSLAGLVPMSVKDKSFEDAVVGRQALMISRFCNVLQSELIAQRRRGHRPAVYVVNQYRYKIGVTHGDPRTMPGGVAANYLSSLTIDFKNKENSGKADDSYMINYNDHPFNIKKNKIGNAPREGEFLMVRNPEHPLGQGFIDDAKSVISWAKARGVVTGGGSSWRIDGKDQKFGRLQEIGDMLYDDLDFFEATKIRLIEDFREEQGLVRQFL